jgi:aspartate aminotransferase-like enzyme
VDVARRCGKEADALQVEWGQPVTAEAIAEHLDTGDYDALTLVHSETSTGVLNPLEEISALKARFPDVMFIVDTVSSFTTVPLSVDALGVDWFLTGSQKALALPPGLALFTASPAAFERAALLEDRGYYFDLLEFRANQEKDMTPSTPCISLINGLDYQTDRILAEGLENRYARHARLNAMVHEWVVRQGFAFFAPEGYRSKGLTCVANNKGIDVARLQDIMKSDHHMVIDGGYGKLKGKTFRLSNMGDETEETVGALVAALDDAMGKL